MDNGMLLIGQTANAPVAANLTPGSGILISNAPGSIIISNSGVLSLGGITGAIALAIGSGGTDINWNRGATTTLNIPDAGPLKTRGTITNGAQSIGGAKTFNNPPLAIPGSAGAGTTPGRLSQCFLRDLSAVGNVGAGEDVLSSVILPANALDTNFVSALRITGWGICAANANAKTIKLYFGATVLTTMAVAVNDGAWRVDAVVVRIGVGNQEAIGEARERAYAAGASVYSGVHILQTNPVETLSSPVTIKTTGEGVANNDIIAKCLMVEILY
jgi:hypothetical protein